MIEREWKSEFNVGCDYIDNAHQKLFKILWKVMDLLSEREYEKQKHACKEAIKFLYSYTVTHFAEEEAYMREIGYEGYEAHKKIHDEMKNETVPMHDKVLQEGDYSKESVRNFVGFFIGWLTGHILVMDKAITGKTFDDVNTSNISVNDKIIKEIENFSNRFFGYSYTVSTQKYDNNVYEKAIYYELSYEDTDIVFMVENGCVKAMIGEMLGKTIEVIDKAVLVSFIQLMMYVGRAVYYSASTKIVSKPNSHRIIKVNEVREYLEKKTVTNYVEWETGTGNMAVFVLNQ